MSPQSDPALETSKLALLASIGTKVEIEERHNRRKPMCSTRDASDPEIVRDQNERTAAPMCKKPKTHSTQPYHNTLSDCPLPLAQSTSLLGSRLGWW